MEAEVDEPGSVQYNDSGDLRSGKREDLGTSAESTELAAGPLVLIYK